MGPSVAVAALWLLLGAVPLVTAAPPPKKRGPPKTELSHPCSRTLSRQVRQRFQSHVARQLRMKGQRTNTSLKWPDQCPFSPLVDVFGWHEKNKTRAKTGARGGNEWLCNYSGKTFKNEHYIDLHMETHYMNMAPENGSGCLADYCEVFGFCNVQEPGYFESLSAEPPSCTPQVLEAHKLTCHSVVDRCAVPDDPTMPNLHADLHRSLCEPLTCEFRAEKHHTDRWWSIVGGISATVFITVALVLYCVCVPLTEKPRMGYDKDRRYRNAPKRFPARDQKPPSDIVDIVPTKPIKQE